jgi:hypothetical protein
MKAGDVVVITTPIGLENRYGWLGGSSRVMAAQELGTPTNLPSLGTCPCTRKDLEVIDEMEPIQELRVPMGAIIEIKRRSLK